MCRFSVIILFSLIISTISAAEVSPSFTRQSRSVLVEPLGKPKDDSMVAKVIARSLVDCAAKCLQKSECESYSFSAAVKECVMAGPRESIINMLSVPTFGYYGEMPDSVGTTPGEEPTTPVVPHNFTVGTNFLAGLHCSSYVFTDDPSDYECEDVPRGSVPHNDVVNSEEIYGPSVVVVRRRTVPVEQTLTFDLGQAPPDTAALETTVWVQGCTAPLSEWIIDYSFQARLLDENSNILETKSDDGVNENLAGSPLLVSLCLTDVTRPDAARLELKISGKKSGALDWAMCSVAPTAKYVVLGDSGECPPLEELEGGSAEGEAESGSAEGEPEAIIK